MTIEINSKLPVNESTAAAQHDQKLRKACRDFEAVFTYQLLRSMRATIDKTGLLDGGQGEDIYESMLDQELAKNMMGWGPNGLAYALYQQLKGIESRGLENSDGSGNRGQLLWPVQADEITSGFGWRTDPFSGGNQFHYGMDLAAEAGTPVQAVLNGRVLLSGHQEGYGNYVVLDHGKGFTTLYAHNLENEVQKGDWVKKGEAIAKVGSSGRSTGPHLHFEVRKNGQYLNPADFLHTQTVGL